MRCSTRSGGGSRCWLLTLLVLSWWPGIPSVTGEGAAPAGKQSEAVQAAVRHFGTQRAEEVVVIAAVLQPQPAPLDPLQFATLEPSVRGSIGATAVIGAGNSFLTVALLRHGSTSRAWDLGEPVAASRIRPARIDREKLSGIEDWKRIPTYKENPDEYRSYCYLIAHAHEVPLLELAKHANRELTYAHLLEQPSRYRGEIVHVVGRLRQLRKFEAPRGVWNEGIKHLYEGLVVSDSYVSAPYYVMLTEVPSGIKPGEKVDYPVICDAYFYKGFFLEDSKRGTYIKAPLLIGRSVVMQKEQAVAEEGSLNLGLSAPVVLVVSGLSVTACVVVFLIWFFGRGDRAVTSRLSRSRNVDFVDPGGNRSGESPEGAGPSDSGSGGISG